MSTPAVQSALEALGQTLGLTATVDGVLLRASVVPDPTRLDLKNFAADGLAQPILAPVRLAAVTKDVTFPTGQIVDGDPTNPASRLVDDPLPDSADLTDPQISPESPLQAILGLLAGLEGIVPVGVFIPDEVTVSMSVCWRLGVDEKCRRVLPLEDGESLPGVLGGDGEEGCSAVTSGASVEMLVVPPLVSLGAKVTCTYTLSAVVTLRALGLEHEVALGPVPVPVPGLPIPTVLVVFSEVQYNTVKDGGRLVIVPTDSPLQGLQAVTDALQAAARALAPLTGLARIVGLVTGLNTVINSLPPVPGSKHKLLFASLDETPDLGDLAPDWRHRSFFDDHGAEDDIDSLLLVSADRRVELFEDQDFEDSKVDVRPGGQLWVGIPDFHVMAGFTPPGASVQSDDSSFHDKAHSLRFLPA